jgi:tetratricopeptide (TPR) repeat protein
MRVRRLRSGNVQLVFALRAEVRFVRGVALLVLVVILLTFDGQVRAAKTANQTNALGVVNFPVACSPAAQTKFNTAVTLLHSFWYDKAEQTFRGVAAIDPTCVMAYWGVAMTHWTELWGPPDDQDVKVATKAIAQAEKIGAKTDREQRFIAAIAAFYHSYSVTEGTGGAIEYTAVMRALHASYPSDRQVALFYALALISTASPDDKSFSNQRAAGMILEPIFAAEPNDPGAAHYIIHAYDNPTLAPKALHAAMEYAKIAPAVPHALHMPSHTFTDLGLWEDSIASNRASLKAEYQNYPTEHLGSSTFDDFHSTDFLEYAYLQAGRASDARTLARQVGVVHTVPDAPYYAAEYVLTLARGLIERGQWEAAANFSLPGGSVSFTKYPTAAAIVDYVRGLGAARSNNVSGATNELRQLATLMTWAKAQHRGFLIQFVGTEQTSLTGWIARARGQSAAALSQLRTAAAAATRGESPPPLLVWPVQEQLAEMLLELNRPSEALSAFQHSLQDDPNRLQSLRGAAQAALETGDREAALRYYRSIVASCPHADADVAEVVKAREYTQASP